MWFHFNFSFVISRRVAVADTWCTVCDKLAAEPARKAGVVLILVSKYL